MKKQVIATVATSLMLATPHGPASAETLRSLYESACAAHGIDDERCLCILGHISDNHSDDAVRYLALDMNLRYDEANLLLEKIGEDEALAVGTAFDEAQNLNCSSSRLAQLKGAYQNADAGGAASAAMAAEKADDTTLVEVVSAPLQMLRAPHPVLDLSAITGDVNIIISVVMQSELIKASANENIRPHLAWYEVVDANGGVDLSGNGKADITTDAPGYASAVQPRALSPKLYFSQQTGGDQVLGEIRLKGGSMYAPFLRLKTNDSATNPFSVGDLSNLASVEDLTQRMKQPQHLHFAFPLGHGESSGALHTVGDNTFVFRPDDVNLDNSVQAEDFLFTINVLNSPQNQ